MLVRIAPLLSDMIVVINHICTLAKLLMLFPLAFHILEPGSEALCFDAPENGLMIDERLND